MNRTLVAFFKALLSVMILVSVSNAAPNIENINGEMPVAWNKTHMPHKYNGDKNFPGSGSVGQSFDIERIDIFVDDTCLHNCLGTAFELNDKKNYGNPQINSGDITLGFKTIDIPRDYQFVLKFYRGNLQGRDQFDSDGINNNEDFLAHGNLKLSAEARNTDFKKIEPSIKIDNLTADLNNLDINPPRGFTANVFWTIPYNSHTPGVSSTRDVPPASHIPEPATLVLFGLGLLVTGSWGRRQKKDNGNHNHTQTGN